MQQRTFKHYAKKQSEDYFPKLNEYGNSHDFPSILATLDIKDETDGKSKEDNDSPAFRTV